MPRVKSEGSSASKVFVGTRIDPTLLAKLDSLCARVDRSRAFMLEDMIKRAFKRGKKS
jgi:predicted transcriptional regulator